MLTIVEELTIVVVVSAVTLAHLLVGAMVLGTTFITALVGMFGIFGLVWLALRLVLALLESISCVIVLLSATNGVLNGGSEGVLLVCDSRCGCCLPF